MVVVRAEDILHNIHTTRKDTLKVTLMGSFRWVSRSDGQAAPKREEWLQLNVSGKSGERYLNAHSCTMSPSSESSQMTRLASAVENDAFGRFV